MIDVNYLRGIINFNDEVILEEKEDRIISIMINKANFTFKTKNNDDHKIIMHKILNQNIFKEKNKKEEDDERLFRKNSIDHEFLENNIGDKLITLKAKYKKKKYLKKN